MDLGLTFEDIALVPQYNNIASRTEPDLSTWLTREVQVRMPLIPANMDTVIGVELGKIIIANGGIPILHRFADLDTQVSWIRELKREVFISSGLNHWEQLCKLLEEAPVGVVIDVAHGHSQMMMNTIGKIKKNFPRTQVIAGNVCTGVAYHDLVTAGADAVKVGIGAGACCTTRIVTGFGVPQFTAIQDC